MPLQNQEGLCFGHCCMMAHLNHWSLAVVLHRFPFPPFHKSVVPVNVLSTPLPQIPSGRFPVFLNPRCLQITVRVLPGVGAVLSAAGVRGEKIGLSGVCDSEFVTF